MASTTTLIPSHPGEMTESHFKVIVVGGGPVGLMAAHILSKAGIDFTILEKYKTVTPEVGASLAFWPPTYRVLDQLRILEPLRPLMNPLKRQSILTHDGNVFYEKNFNTNEIYHGYVTQMFHRSEFIKGLYDTLTPESRAKIHVNKDVTSIETSDTSATVTCADGTSYTGSMILGADGVHSTVRNLLSTASPTPEPPFLATYRVLFGSAPRPPTVAAEHVYEAHGPAVASQLFVGAARMWFFVYERLPAPTAAPAAYTPGDAAAFAARLVGLHLAPALTLGDVYAARLGGGLTNLEEGVARAWAGGHGRVVLVGDAAHKVTPNLGWGFNSGVQDLVVLANGLRRLVGTEGTGRPTAAQLGGLAAEYQAARTKAMALVASVSGKVLRGNSWASWADRLLDRVVFPATGADQLVARLTLARVVAASPVLDWLSEEHFAQGEVPWKHMPLGDEKEAEGGDALGVAGYFGPLLMTVGVVFSYLMAQSGIKAAIGA